MYNFEQKSVIPNLLEILKRHSQLAHMRIRYHFIANLHVTETRSILFCRKSKSTFKNRFFSGWRELFSKLSAKTSVQVSRVPKLTVSLWIRNVCGRYVIYLSAMHTWKQRFYKTALCDPGSLPQFYFFLLDQPTHFNERKGERKHFMRMVSLLKFTMSVLHFL